MVLRFVTCIFFPKSVIHVTFTEYLQVEVNISMGIVAICAIQITAVLIFLPFAIREFRGSKTYTVTPDQVSTTKFVSSEENIDYIHVTT